ncbi:MAG: hypothetical protein KJ666_16575 [Bacteroidetes bacterium]|nr:hypothetical protein [Bacteroidota bacterium]
MKKFIFILFLTQIQFTHAQSNFTNFVSAVNSASSDAEKTRLVDSFIVHAHSVGIPYIEGTTCNFIYRGTGANIYLAGDMNGWSASTDKLQKLSTTNFFYLTKTYELDARLDYKFVRDGNWILDPENLKTVSGGFGPNSELAMPNYVQPPEIKYYSEISHGTLKDTTFFSLYLGNPRTVRVYLPPNYSTSTDSFPMILFHDGLEYVSLASAHNVIDYLISRNEIEPVIAVFIPPVNRTQEYAGGSMGTFTNFIVNEVIPYIDSRYRTKRNSGSRATAGASNGGNISLWLAYSHPEVFGNVAAHSSNVITSTSQGFQNSPKLNLKVYLDIGKYDIARLIPLVRNLKSILESKSYDLYYREYNEGHSWGFWRAHIDDYLKFFFPKTSTKVEENKEINSIDGFKLYQNYPNPFNPETTIKYVVSSKQYV